MGETRAREKPGVEDRMKKAMDAKIHQKRAEIDRILVEIEKLEEEELPRHSFIVDETESNDLSHSIPVGPDTIRGVSTPMSDSTETTANGLTFPYDVDSVKERTKDFSQDFDSEGRVRIRSPPPHTPQSPYNTNSPRSLSGYSGDLGPLTFENISGQRKKQKSSKKLSLGPMIRSYDDIRSQVEEQQKMEATMISTKNSAKIPPITSISQAPLIPPQTKRIRFNPKPTSLSRIADDSDSDSQCSAQGIRNGLPRGHISGVDIGFKGRIIHTQGLNDWIKPHEFVKGETRDKVSQKDDVLNLGERGGT